MAGSVVGQIALELNVNTKEFKQQLQNLSKTSKTTTGNLSSMFSVIGKVAAVVTAAKTIINFSKQCLQLGSDLAEVQNVVDVTFGNMSNSVNSWAKNAMTSFGLSEKVAKEYVGQLGAMSKAFGNSTQEAYTQATQLAGLVGDVASFYNLTTDEAFTKLKAVYTGETESLKSLGVVMTQTALDEYALAKGYGKTTKSMTEQEKVALRLAFVTDRLSDASGDFVRTSDGWANQTRVLSLRFDALKASIGQGLINALLPVVRVLNQILERLQVVADAFADFMEGLFGDAGSTSSGIGAAASFTGDIASNLDEGASSAAAIKKSLAGFDQINILSSNSGGSTDAGTSGGGSSDGMTDNIVSDTEEATNSAVGLLDVLKKKLEEITSWTGFDRLWKNLKAGIKKIDFTAIKTNFERVFKKLVPIAKSTFDGIGVKLRSFNGLVGTGLGGLVSITGKSIELAGGGIAKFLETQGGRISQWVTENSNKIATGFDNMSFTAETIFGSFWNALETNKATIESSISNILTTFTNMTITVDTIFTDMWVSITEGFATWVAENQPLIDETINGLIETVTAFTDFMNTTVGDMFASIENWWNTSGKPVWDNLIKVLNDIMTVVLNLWNTVLKPIIDKVIAKVSELWTTTLKPIWDNILGLLSDIGENISALWNNWLKPIVNWIVEKFGPPIVKIINKIITVFTDVGKTVGSVINGAITTLRGIIQFITGIFSKDWGKAWDGIKTAFSGVWTSISKSFAPIINPIISTFEKFINGIIGGLNWLIKQINKISFDVPDWVPGIGGKKLGFDVKYVSEASIPRLATGGYVAANTPQLAIIGDNKREGEIVAPESKITEAVVAAFRQFLPLFNNNGNSKPIYLTIKLGDGTFWEGFVDYHNDYVKRTGDSPLLI